MAGDIQLGTDAKKTFVQDWQILLPALCCTSEDKGLEKSAGLYNLNILQDLKPLPLQISALCKETMTGGC